MTSENATIRHDILELGSCNNLAQHRKCSIFSSPKSLHPSVGVYVCVCVCVEGAFKCRLGSKTKMMHSWRGFQNSLGFSHIFLVEVEDGDGGEGGGSRWHCLGW